MAMAMAMGGFWLGSGAGWGWCELETEVVVEVEGGAGTVLWRSPRMHTSAWMTVRPPKMMFCVPWIWALRETLLPVSCWWV